MDDVVLLSEFIKGRLYFATLRSTRRPPCTKMDHFFSTDDDYLYDSFNYDFGPLCLSDLARYCNNLKNKLYSPDLKHKRIIHYTSVVNPEQRANATYLITAFAVLCLGKIPSEATMLLQRYDQRKSNVPDLLPFRDASLSEKSSYIHLPDCLSALYFASRAGLFDPNDFNIDEYEKFKGTRNGDLNWVVPHRLLAFSGPRRSGFGYKPETYIKYFKKNGVAAVVRLNIPEYDRKVFVDAGIMHYDLFFPDGTPPTRYAANAFHRLCDEYELGKWSRGVPKAIAVHCKAGLGRTGVLIASRLMSRYGMRAKEAVAWIRICRPGSIMSSQQEWLENNEPALMMRFPPIPRILNNRRGIHYEQIPKIFMHGIYSIQEKFLANKIPMKQEKEFKRENQQMLAQGTNKGVQNIKQSPSMDYLRSNKHSDAKRVRALQKESIRPQTWKRPHS